MTSKKIEYFTKTQLKERGWTEGSIKKFMPSPSVTKTNPRFSGGHPMKLYCVEQVNNIELSTSFQQWYQKTIVSRRKKSNAATKTVKNKKDTIIREFNSINITLKKISYEEVIRRAKNNYCEYNNIPNSYLNEADDNFIHRISVNWLRHSVSNYDYNVGNLSGRIGKQEAYAIIKNRILDLIAEKYPILENEALRQKKCV